MKLTQEQQAFLDEVYADVECEVCGRPSPDNVCMECTEDHSRFVIREVL